MSVVPDDQDVERLVLLGSLIKARREHLGRGIEPIARAQRMSKDTWRLVEIHHQSVGGTVYGRIEAALGWAGGSINAFLRGGPQPSEDVVATVSIDGVSIQVIGVRELVDAYVNGTDQDRANLMATAQRIRRSRTQVPVEHPTDPTPSPE